AALRSLATTASSHLSVLCTVYYVRRTLPETVSRLPLRSTRAHQFVRGVAERRRRACVHRVPRRALRFPDRDGSRRLCLTRPRRRRDERDLSAARPGVPARRPAR